MRYAVGKIVLPPAGHLWQETSAGGGLMHETQLDSAADRFFNFKGRVKSHIDKKNEHN